MITFPEIQAVLDAAIAAWKTNPTHSGLQPDLTVHNKAGFDPFGWSTKDELLKASAKGFRLIDPATIGTNPPKGSDALIVRILRGPVTLTDPQGHQKIFPRMPKNGDFLEAEQIKKIEDWIDAGCPD